MLMMHQRNILLCSRSLCVGSWKQRNVLLCSRSLGGVNRGGVPQGRRGQRYGINPLVTLCHSPYVLRKQGETISPAGSVGQRYSINPLVTLCHSPYVLRKQGETILPAGSVGLENTVSTPSSRCATPPMCSANRGRQSCQPVEWYLTGGGIESWKGAVKCPPLFTEPVCRKLEAKKYPPLFTKLQRS